jgi:putative aldouronate transport system substrate-binding protein
VLDTGAPAPAVSEAVPEEPKEKDMQRTLFRRRVLAALVALVLPVTLAVATGGSEAPAAAGAVKLKWAFFTGGPAKDDGLVYAEFNKRLAKYMPGVTVEFNNIAYAQYKEKYSLMMAAKEDLDLVWAGYLFDIDEEIAKGAYVPLNDLLTKYAPKLYASKTPDNWARISTDGKIMGYPHGNPSTANTLNDIRLIASVADKHWPNVKQDMARIAEKRGMTQEDYDILAAFLERAKQGGDIMKGWDVALARWAFAEQIMDWIKTPYGLHMLNNDLKVVNLYETADYKLMCDNMSKWFKSGYIIKDIMSIENKRAYEEKPDGNIMFTHGWQYVETQKQQEQYSKGLGFKVYYYPLHNDWFIGNARANVVTAIPTQAKNQVKAIQFLELLNTQESGELATILAFGVEGKHWNKVADASGKTPMTIKTLEYDASQSDPSTTVSYATYFWSIVDNPMMGTNQGIDLSGSVVGAAQRAKSRVTPIMGFLPNTKSVATEWAQVTAVITEYQYQLEFGTLADNTKVYNEFLAKLKAAGNDKIIATIQAQLDAFMKSKK